MKGKKIWAIVLSICLVVGSLGVTSVMASGETDVAVSVTTDKTALKAGDVITVSANLDRFQSTIASDTDPLLTTMQFDIPYDSDVFEFVEGSLNSGYVNTNILGVRHIPDQSLVRVAVVNANKPGTGEIIPGNGIEQTENPYPFFTYQLKVKDTIAETKSVNLNISNAIFGNVYTDAEYTYSQTPAAVTVYTAPKITVNGSETVEASYTQAVTVAASDNSEITVNGEKMTNPCTITSKGEYTIVATNAAGLTAEKTIKIEPVVESIEMKTLPDKTEYVKGATLDVTGGTILAKLSNEETEEVPLTLDMCDVTTFNTPGPQTITVTYGGKTTTFEVEVHDKEVVKVELISGPTDAEIVEGTELDLTGAAIRVTYSDNSVDQSIPVTLDMLSGFDNNKVGEQNVFVVYQNVTADQTFTVTVVAKSVTGVQITDKNDSVKEAHEYVPTGELTVTYDNGTQDVVSFTDASVVTDISAVDTKVPGIYTVTLHYTDIRGNVHDLSYEVTVVEATGIEVVPSNLEVTQNTDLKDAGIEFLLTYANGEKETLTFEDVEIVGYDAAKAGKQELTASYEFNGKTFELNFNVYVLVKSDMDVSLSGGSSDYYLIMSEVQDEQMRQRVLTELNKLSLNINQYSVLDIDLLSKETGLSVETDDILNITMQIPEGFDTTKRLTVYGVAEDGTLTKLETIVKDGKLSFQANLFAQYVLVEEGTEAETTTSGDAGQTETTTAGSSVETGDSAKGIIVLAVVGMTMAGFVLVSRRKVQK